jgi:hypothetical protein
MTPKLRNFGFVAMPNMLPTIWASPAMLDFIATQQICNIAVSLKNNS